MKKRMISLLLCLTLVFSLGSYALAVNDTANEQANAAADSLAVSDEPYYLVNGVAVTDPGMMVDHQITYVSLQTVINAVYPTAPVTWNDALGALVSAPGLSMTVCPGKQYVEANGRFLYVLYGVKSVNGRVLVPIRTIAQAMGGYVTWDSTTGVTSIYSGTPIASGESFYSADAVNWLSRIINAESGHEPLEGKLGVGTVILNRVASPQFPNTIYEVIFDHRYGTWQFTPVGSGAIQATPGEESVIAAKLCLEGVRVGGGSLYFVNLSRSPNCWARRNRPYVATIGAHSFFG